MDAVSIAVHDNTEAAVAGALVGYSWSDGSTGSCTTGTDGRCTATSATYKKSDVKSLTLTVTGVSNERAVL